MATTKGWTATIIAGQLHNDGTVTIRLPWPGDVPLGIPMRMRVEPLDEPVTTYDDVYRKLMADRASTNDA